jgi:hypothetical protein
VRVVQRAFDSFAGQRNFAVEHCELRHEWIFHLEVMTPDLSAEVLERIAATDKDAYRVSSKLMFHGKFLRHAGLFPGIRSDLVAEASYGLPKSGVVNVSSSHRIRSAR